MRGYNSPTEQRIFAEAMVELYQREKYGDMEQTINQQRLVEMTRSTVLNNPSTKLFGITIKPRHELFINGTDAISPAVTRTEFALSAKRLSDTNLIRQTGRVTARLVKDAICGTLKQIDPRFDPSNPSRRMKRDAQIAMYVIPAVGRKPKQRFIHYHGWILLNTQPNAAEPDHVMSVRIREDDVTVDRVFPKPVALLIEQLVDLLGPNINVAANAEDIAGEKFAAHLIYVTRTGRVETTFPLDPIAQPRGFFTDEKRPRFRPMRSRNSAFNPRHIGAIYDRQRPREPQEFAR